MKKIFLLLLLVFAKTIFCQTRVQKMDSLLTEMYAKGSFNGNVLVAEQGKILYNQSFGHSNETTKAKLDENSIFELASVSKQFTAMAIVILKEKGKLKYDDLMSKHIPELSFYKDITIRNLLIHTSGMPAYEQFMDSIWDKSKIATNKDIIASFAKLEPKVEFEPNTKWEYSNTGYALLASIIEKISGRTYGDFLNENIFKPLNMNNTFVYTRRYAPKKVENYAFGYVYSTEAKKYVLPDETDQFKFVIWMDGIVGDGTVNSTVIDLLNWDRALHNNKLVSAKSMNEIFSAAELNDKSKTKYGFGWQLEESEFYGKVLYHGGGWPGYRTFIERHPKTDKTIIVLQNYLGNKTENPTVNLKKILYNIPFPKYIKLPEEKKEMLVGKYKNDEGKIRTVIFENGLLYRKIDETNNKTELRPVSETKFHLVNSNPDIFLEFEIKDNKAINYTLTQPETKTVGVAIKIKTVAYSFWQLLEKSNGPDAFAKLIEMVSDSTYILDENELNQMAYDYFFNDNKPDFAFETLRAALYLFPKSDNLYDSYGELLAKSGKKEEAIIMYKKSIAINPKNENSIKALEKLEKK